VKVLEQNKNINDFLCETQKDLNHAQEIFYSNNFLNDYSITDERIIKLYNRIVSDTDRENALNNFLVMAKLKHPPKITFNKKRIEIKLKYFEDRKIRYKIPVITEGSGSLDLSAQAKYPAEWLEIKNNEFLNQKVIDGQLFEIFCIIDTKLIASSKAYNVMVLKSPYNTVEIELFVNREKAVKAELSKSSYISHEKGFLKVYNNTGEDLMIEISFGSIKIIGAGNSPYYFLTY